MHYYVMQFIQGLGLDQVVAELRRLQQQGSVRAGEEGRAAPTGEAGAASAVGVARSLLTGQFAAPASGGRQAPGSASHRGADAPRSPQFDSSVHLPGRAEGSSLPDSGQAYWQGVARIGIQVAEALHYAAGQGILHRDIKPSNLLLDTQGTVWVTDFGLVKTTADQDQLTHTGDIVGTVRYMAPERFRGQADVRGDVYSLGLTLYELVALRPAFAEADRNRLLQRVMHDTPVRPGKLNPEVPRDLETIVLKALERDPARRYQTAAELAEDLKRFVDDRPIWARRVSPAERLWRWCRRNPALAAALGAVAVLALAFVVFQALALHRLAAAQQRTQDALDESRRGQAELALDKGQLLGEQGDTHLALLWMARSLKLAPPGADALQAVARANLGAWRGRVSPLRLVLPLESAGMAVAFTPDGKTLLTVSLNKTVQRWDAASGQPGTAIPDAPYPEGHMNRVTFSPDRSAVLIGYHDGAVRLLDLARGTRWQSRQEGAITAAAFSPDGTKVLIGYTASRKEDLHQGGWTCLLDVATGKPLRPPVKHDRQVHAAAFSPDGQTYVTESGIWNSNTKGQAGFWDLDGNQTREPLEHALGALAVAFSPDGTKLLTGHWDFTARLWDVATGRPLLPPLPHEAPVCAVAFSPNGGHTLLTGCYDGTARLWGAATGQPLGPPLWHQEALWGAAFSPDGQAVLTGGTDNTARLWEVPTSSPAGPTRPPDGRFFPLAVSPDGQTLLTRSADNTVQLRDAVTDRPLKGTVPLRPTYPVLAGAFRPDLRAVVTVGANRTDVHLWNAETGAAVHLPHPVLHVHAVAFSPEGKTFVTTLSLDGRALLRDATTGELLDTLRHKPVGPVFAAAYSPDGKTLLTGAVDGTVRLWDTTTRQPIRVLPHPSAIFAAVYSPEGKAILSGGTDRTARLWDAATGTLLGPPLAHPGGVLAVAFSRDGRTLLTGCRDHNARLWDAATGKAIGPPLPHPGPVRHVAFAPDGRTVWTALGEDQLLRSWQLPTPVTGDPEQVELWAQVVTGMELEANGGVRVLDAADWQERAQRLQERPVR